MDSRTFRLVGIIAVLAGGPAVAEDFSYADEHGNLIVESDAGYKRILVGQGHNAERLAAYLGAGRGEAALLSGGDRAFADSQGNLIVRGRAGSKRVLVGQADSGAVSEKVPSRGHPVVCTGPDGVIKGRSYMYGVDRGETPVVMDCE